MFTTRISRLPYLALLATLACTQLVFWQASEDSFGPVEAMWAKVFVCLSVIPLIASLPNIKYLFRSFASRAVVLWAAWLFVSALTGSYPRQGAKTALEYSLYATVFFVPAALDARQRARLWACFLAAATLAAFYGCMQHFGLDPWQWTTNFAGRPLGTIGNPDFFAGHLVLPWCLLLGWLVFGKTRSKLAWLAFGVMTLCQAFSLTLGAWLGMAVGLAALGVLLALGWPLAGTKPRAWGIGLLAGLGVVGLAALAAAKAPHLVPGLGSFWQSKSISVTNRTMMWKVALDLWREKPFFGSGLGSYRPLYPLYQSRILASQPGFNYVVTWLPHENFLYWLSETGLLGLILFLLVPIAAIFHARRSPQPKTTAALILALIGLQGVCLLNTFSNIVPTTIVYWFILGSLVFVPRDQGSQRSVHASGLLPHALISASILALVFGVFAGRQLVANRALKVAHRLAKEGQFKGAAVVLGKVEKMQIAELTPQSLVGPAYDLGEALRQDNRLEEARQAYAADLAENPWCPETHNMLGAVTGQLGNLPEASRLLETATRLCPGYSGAMTNLGITYAQAGNVSGAAKVWQDVLKIEPDAVQVKDYLARLKTLR